MISGDWAPDTSDMLKQEIVLNPSLVKIFCADIATGLHSRIKGSTVMNKIYKDARGDTFLMIVALETKAAKHQHRTEASLIYQKACAYLHSINFSKEDGSLQHAFNNALDSYLGLGVMAKDLMTDQAKIDALQKLADNLPERLREAVAVASRSSDNIDRVCNNVSDADMQRRPAKVRFIKLRGEIMNTLANSNDEV